MPPAFCTLSHALVLERDFDEEGTFFYIPFSGLEAMVEVFRSRVIWMFVEKQLLNNEFATKLLSWRHLRFSINNIVRIKLIVGLDIFKKLSVFGGVSYNIFIPNGNEFDPALVPETQTVSDWVSEGYKSWPGFFIGIQF